MIGFMPPQATLAGQHRSGNESKREAALFLHRPPTIPEYVGRHRKPESLDDLGLTHPAWVPVRKDDSTPFGFFQVRSA